VLDEPSADSGLTFAVVGAIIVETPERLKQLLRKNQSNGRSHARWPWKHTQCAMPNKYLREAFSQGELDIYRPGRLLCVRFLSDIRVARLFPTMLVSFSD
jgi:hypothetical protein